MPQLPRSESASSGSGFSWKPVMRPSASCSTTPYSRVSETCLDRQRRDPARLAMPRDERAQIDVGEGVAGDDQERLIPEELAARANPAGGPQQLLLVAVGEALAEVLADRVREVVQVGDHLLEAVAIEQVEDVRHHRPIEHRHHRFGDLVRQGAQARAEAGREDHRLHGANNGSDRACRARRPARRCRRPAPLRASSAAPRARRGAGARPSRRGAWAARTRAARTRRSW